MPAAGARPKATKIYLIYSEKKSPKNSAYFVYTYPNITKILLERFTWLSLSYDLISYTLFLLFLHFFIILRFSSLSSSCSIQSRFLLEQVHRFQRSISWKRILFRLVKKWYHRCLSICLLLLFHTRGSSQVPEKRNQLFGTIDNLLTHFEWANTDEEVFMCLWKKVSVIVARRVLFKRNIMHPIFWRRITSKIYFFLSSAYVKWNWLQTVLTESSCCHELLNSVKLNHFCPYSFIRLSTSLFLSKAGFCLKLWDEKKKAQYFILILPLCAKSFKDWT